MVGRSSTNFVIALAAVFAIVAIVLLVRLRGNEDGAKSDEPSLRESMEAARSPDAGADRYPAMDEEAEEAASVAEAGSGDGPDEGGPAFQGLRPMPDSVRREFEAGTAPISPEQLAEMRSAKPEIPHEVYDEMRRAGTDPIPPEVMRDFENPYPTIPEEELERLRENGRNSGRPSGRP